MWRWLWNGEIKNLYILLIRFLCCVQKDKDIVPSFFGIIFLRHLICSPFICSLQCLQLLGMSLCYCSLFVYYYWLKIYLICLITSQKYDRFIQKGLDLKNVSPLDDVWLQNIMAMVPCFFWNLTEPLGLLVDEIKEDYLHSNQSAICIYFCYPKFIGVILICNS